MEPLAPHLQTWLAENLLAGCTPESLVEGLIAAGTPAEQAAQEVRATQAHPYMEAAQRIVTIAKKREALLKTLDYYQRFDPAYLKLEPTTLPPFKQFLTEYFAHNRPGLFTGAFDHWPARQWTPNILRDKVGADTTIQIQRGRTAQSDYEINAVSLKRDIPFGEFVDMVEQEAGNDFYLTANNNASNRAAFKVLEDDTGDLGDGYLNLAIEHQRLFLWMGPAGIITPLHHDLTHNIFLQIYGEKRFRLIPAMQIPYTYNHIGVFNRVDLLDPQPEQYPLFQQTTPIDITVKAGEMLYIPIGWIHHVEGLSTSISISMTNFKANNTFFDYPAGSWY